MLFDSFNTLDDRKVAFEQLLKSLVQMCEQLKAENRSLFNENQQLKTIVAAQSNGSLPVNSASVGQTADIPIELKKCLEEALSEVDAFIEWMDSSSHR